MAKIKFINVEKSFGKNKVIKKFNLEINDGEFTVLVGPSGCGKSTLLRMISGLEKIDKGTILLNKNIINDLLPSKRDMAMVFQSYALYPHMNVYENMSFGLKMEKISKNNIQKKVNQAAKILKIKHLLDRKPGQLSGGQRQRVAIGRAISRNPKIFLFDEPLSNLDAALRSEMRVEISKLHKKIKTNMIYVTHDQVEAMTLADKMVILNEGRIEQVGSPDEIYNYPNNLFVAEFIGTPKMNIIKINKDASFVVFHDAYQYFEKRFGLSVIGALTVNPDVMPGAEQLSEIRGVIEHEKAKCIFSEPQFTPNIINSIASDTGVKTGVLDPLGANIDKGKNMYFDLIKDMSNSLKDCS